MLGAAGQQALLVATHAPGAAKGRQSPGAAARWQEGGGKKKKKKKKLSELIADFVTGFDLKAVPPLAVERARLAFTDTIGVMLAGSQEHVAQIACEMVKAEGSAPVATVVGQSLRAAPQRAALATGVAAHAMDYDFSLHHGAGFSTVPIIPALLPLAEGRPGRRPGRA